jgi:hypothetical protein
MSASTVSSRTIALAVWMAWWTTSTSGSTSSAGSMNVNASGPGR